MPVQLVVASLQMPNAPLDESLKQSFDCYWVIVLGPQSHLDSAPLNHARDRLPTCPHLSRLLWRQSRPVQAARAIPLCHNPNQLLGARSEFALGV